MSRRATSWASLGADLARVLSEKRPTWVKADTADAARVLLKLLRRDAVAVVEPVERTEAATTLGVGEASVFRWIAPGGWLEGVERKSDEQ